MICNNFVCAFSSSEWQGKIYCLRNHNSISDGAPDCDVTRSMHCSQYKWFECKLCGHEFKCYKQREKGVFYSPDTGLYVPATSSRFAEKAMQNDLVNAKRDIYNTAWDNYKQGYKVTTTVNQMYKKYGKAFPDFTKEFINKSVLQSIIEHLENE